MSHFHLHIVRLTCSAPAGPDLLPISSSKQTADTHTTLSARLLFSTKLFKQKAKGERSQAKKARPRPGRAKPWATRHDDEAAFRGHPTFPFVSGFLLLLALLRVLRRVLVGLVLRAGGVAAEVRRQEEEEQPQEGHEWRRRRCRCHPQEEQLHLQGRHQVA